MNEPSADVTIIMYKRRDIGNDTNPAVSSSSSSETGAPADQGENGTVVVNLMISFA